MAGTLRIVLLLAIAVAVAYLLLAPRPGATEAFMSVKDIVRGSRRVGSTLVRNDRLRMGESIVSSSGGRYMFAMQKDGNAVVYDLRENGRALWATGTQAQGRQVTMLRSGGIAVSGRDGRPVWSSVASHKAAPDGGFTGPYRLAMQTDGNLVLYDSRNRAVWDRSGM